MNIIQCAVLTSEQELQIQELFSFCTSEEPLMQELFLSSAMNVKPKKPCFFLGYLGQQLVSFLSAFFPTKEEVEFNGFTHPDFRKHGYMSALIDHALPLFSEDLFAQALFIREQESQSGWEYLSKRYPVIARTEYVMEMQSSSWNSFNAAGQLTEVTKKTQNTAQKIISEIFEQDEKTSKQQLGFLLSHPDRQVFLYWVGEKPIGIANIHAASQVMIMIHSVGIIPRFRRKGYGYQMIGTLLNYLRTKASIVSLEVDSDNPPALALYRKLGFYIQNRIDYHARLF
ncbi:MAG: GNAT family N-acetyltransferase [Sphaerochaetaceae bacterium]